MSQAAYVLHTRPYRETSLLVEAFTAEHGRISLVARGAKRGKSKDSSILQPFIPLSINWLGSGDLVTLTQVELRDAAPNLSSKQVICGLYLNELLLKLLHKWDPYADLFDDYEQSINAFSVDIESSQIILRKFEKRLLKSIGYALQLTTEIESGKPVLADQFYKFEPNQGPRLVAQNNLDAISGASLLALAKENFDSIQSLIDIKRLMRKVIAHHLGSNTLGIKYANLWHW